MEAVRLKASCDRDPIPGCAIKLVPQSLLDPRADLTLSVQWDVSLTARVPVMMEDCISLMLCDEASLPVLFSDMMFCSKGDIHEKNDSLTHPP